MGGNELKYKVLSLPLASVNGQAVKKKDFSLNQKKLCLHIKFI